MSAWEPTAPGAAATGECVLGGIRNVIVFVDDLEQALDFYVGKLGLERRRDDGLEAGLRAVEVSVPGDATSILLVRPALEAMGADETSRARDRIGEPTGVVLEVDRLDAVRDELERRGVEFVAAPGWDLPGARTLRFRDSCENELMLVESVRS